MTKKQLEIFGDFVHPRLDGKYTRIYIIRNIDKSNLVLHEGDEIVETTLEEAFDQDMTPLAKEVTTKLLQSI